MNSFQDERHKIEWMFDDILLYVNGLKDKNGKVMSVNPLTPKMRDLVRSYIAVLENMYNGEIWEDKNGKL